MYDDAEEIVVLRRVLPDGAAIGARQLVNADIVCRYIVFRDFANTRTAECQCEDAYGLDFIEEVWTAERRGAHVFCDSILGYLRVSLGKCIEELREALGAEARQLVRKVREKLTPALSLERKP